MSLLRARVPTPLAAALLVLAAVVGLFLVLSVHMPASELDPAFQDPAADPGRFRDDDWDRRSARSLEGALGIEIVGALGDPDRDVAVVTRIYEGCRRAAGAPEIRGCFPPDATSAVLIRRPRAAYVVAERAMRSSSAGDREWGLDAAELLEGRLRGGLEAPAWPPPYSGPERMQALSRVGGLALGDPDSEVRVCASRVARLLPDAALPPLDAIASVVTRETDAGAQRQLFWLLSRRGAPAEMVLGAALVGFPDPVTVAVGFHDLVREENRALIEDAYERGDAACRAGIGESFYRHQSSMPWAELVVMRGLADPDPRVRERFAKGSLVLRPPSAELRRVLEALSDETECAAWALCVMDGAENGCPCSGDRPWSADAEASER